MPSFFFFLEVGMRYHYEKPGFIQVSTARFIFATIRFITAVRSIKLEKRAWL